MNNSTEIKCKVEYMINFTEKHTFEPQAHHEKCLSSSTFSADSPAFLSLSSFSFLPSQIKEIIPLLANLYKNLISFFLLSKLLSKIILYFLDRYSRSSGEWLLQSLYHSLFEKSTPINSEKQYAQPHTMAPESILSSSFAASIMVRNGHRIHFCLVTSLLRLRQGSVQGKLLFLFS